MKRRSFISSLLLACAAPAILLRAAPDKFKWAAGRELLVPNSFDSKLFYGKWTWIGPHQLMLYDRTNLVVPLPAPHESYTLGDGTKLSLTVTGYTGVQDCVFYNKDEPCLIL